MTKEQFDALMDYINFAILLPSLKRDFSPDGNKNELDKRRRKLEYELVNHGACPICNGLGMLDDADPGDIYFKTWPCSECNGTGRKRNADES